MRVWKVTRRILLGVVAFVVVAVGIVLALLHTDWGRDVAREQIEARLDEVFHGGATIGSLEGSVLGTLVLRDVVIDGPDDKPAITVERLSLGVPVRPLLSKRVRIEDLRAEGVTIDLRRDASGRIQQLTRPGPASGWAVDIPRLAVSRGHLRVEGAAGQPDTNIDGIHLAGSLDVAADQSLGARVLAAAHWRERGAPIWIDATLANDDTTLRVPSLIATVGELGVFAAGLHVVKPSQPSLARPIPARLEIGGLVAVDATGRAIEQLAPGTAVPVDELALAALLAPLPGSTWTRATLAGAADGQPIYGHVEADLEALRARGLLATGRVDLAKYSGGRLQGHSALAIAFDAAAPAGGALPVGTALIHAGGELAGIEDAIATIAVSSDGERAATLIAAAARGALSARIGAVVRKRGDRLVLEESRVIANVRDPSRITEGKAPVRGALAVDVSASGELSPDPDLAARGRVFGSRLRIGDVSIRSLRVAVDARHLPSKPVGRAELEARDIERGSVFLRELDLNAANRPDGKIAVTMRTRPRTAPWLVEADAIVTPGDTVTIDLERHFIRVANESEWRGGTGRITISPARVTVEDVASASTDGKLSVAGHLHRAGPRAGDLQARIGVERFELSNLSKGFRGELGARVDVERRSGRFAGTVDLDARGVALDPDVIPFDIDAKVDARSDKLVVAAKAASPGLGAVDLDVDIDAPDDITNATHWKRLHREHIRSARLQLIGLDAGKLAALAKAQGYRGRIDGDIVLSPKTTGGTIHVRELNGPALKNLGPLSANITVAQTGPDELTPTLVATIDDRAAAGTPVHKPLARIEAQAALGIPDHLFDPAEWRRLGKPAFHGGSLRVADVMIEPALVDRLQVRTNLRGRASLVAEVEPGLRAAKLRLEVANLRGRPISQPLRLQLSAAAGTGDTTVSMSLGNMTSQQQLLNARGRVPLALADWLAGPVLADVPLHLTAMLPDVPAAQVLQTFGRPQMTGGALAGTIHVGGTLGKPTVRAAITGTNLQVPPGPRGRPLKTIDRVTIDADWDGTTGRLAIDGKQRDGMLSLVAQGDPSRLEAATVSLVARQFDLTPLLAFAPGPLGGASGRLDAKVDVEGLDPNTAKIAGELHMTRARIPLAPQIGTLRRAKIDVVAGDKLTVNVDGRLGRGTVKASAQLAMAGAKPIGGEAKITLREVSPIGAVEPDVDADVAVKLHQRNDAWIADIAVSRATVKVPKGRGEPLDPVGKPDDMVFVTDANQVVTTKVLDDRRRPERPTLIANIHIKPTYIESPELRGYIRGNLRVERDAEAVSVVGKIEADRGALDLFGRRYQLDRAILRFDGSTDPLLDVLVTHDFPDVTTRTQVRGRLSDPELVMSSDPGTYSQGQLLGFLLGGEPQGQPADGNPRDQAASAGASLIANRLGGYVKDALPLDVDVLRYETATSTSGAAITVGTWLTRSLFIAYRRRIDARPDENAGEGEIEYWLGRRVVVEGVIGDRGYNGVDLLWRRRW